MIWGEVINSVRSLHLKLVQEFSLDPKLLTKDIELTPANFPYPEALDDFDEWNEIAIEPELQDLIPLHSVERVLIEGPILPIQKVSFHSKNEIDQLFAAVLRLEKEWLEKTRTLNPTLVQFIENDCSLQSLRISSLAGFKKLSSISSSVPPPKGNRS